MSTLEFAPPSSREIHQKGLTATVITPWWPSAIWFPVIKEMSDISTDSNPTRGGTTSTRKRKRPTKQEPTLALNSMENKRRQRGTDAGLSSSAIDLLTSQEAFVEWTRSEEHDPSVPNAIMVVNYLCHARILYSWNRNTTLIKKSAFLKLYEDTSSITNNIYFKQFMEAMKGTGVFQMEHTQAIDISPIISHFRKNDNADLDMPTLSRKLCWLLGVCAFLRPDDVSCIDISKTKVSDNGLLLSVIFLKERRGGQRIIKVISVGRHANDKRLCPVDEYEEYTRCIADTPLEINHYKDPNYKDKSKALRATSIGTLMSGVTCMIPDLPSDRPPPKPRAIGSTSAAISDISTQNIMVQGNWSSDKVLNRHYRVSRKTMSNVTLAILGSL
ncbi:hypothetical protein BGZ46_010550 [Entomortierella lignicola]|nr:hypothetical protein BGZ46_010550 [Entomortierella lignicola]